MISSYLGVLFRIILQLVGAIALLGLWLKILFNDYNFQRILTNPPGIVFAYVTVFLLLAFAVISFVRFLTLTQQKPRHALVLLAVITVIFIIVACATRKQLKARIAISNAQASSPSWTVDADPGVAVSSVTNITIGMLYCFAALLILQALISYFRRSKRTIST
jgi:hypothetical protein